MDYLNEEICHCFKITRGDIVKAIKENNLKSVEDVGKYTNAGTACGSCKEDIFDIIKKVVFLKKL